MDNQYRQCTNGSIRACQININGLSDHSITTLENFVHVQNIKILAMQETGFIRSQNLGRINNLVTFFNKQEIDCKGVGLAIDTVLKPQLIPELLEGNKDAVWATCQIAGKNIIVGSVYCTPENRSTSSLRELLLNIKKAKVWCDTNKFHGMIIYGDYNSRSHIWGDITENKRGKELEKFIDIENMIICFSK